MNVRVEKTDSEIFAPIQRESRQNISKIAEEAQKGISTIHAGKRALQDAKVITEYSAVLSLIDALQVILNEAPERTESTHEVVLFWMICIHTGYYLTQVNDNEARLY
jgi:DNA-binding Lrp family transcriptional regulator